MMTSFYHSVSWLVLFAAIAVAGIMALAEPAWTASRSFEPAPNSPVLVGSTPTTVASADFDDDGKLDLAAQNNGSNSVSVRLGNSDGTFRTQPDVAVGANPASVISADFDEDGNADLATANWSSRTVSVLLGNGNGTFDPKQDFAAGSNPSSVISGDFNGDSHTDLAVANFTSNDVSVLLGNGNGTFGTTGNFSIDLPCGGFCIPAAAAPNQVVTADFNGDTKPDLATANMGSCAFFCTPGGVSVLLGNGDGTFQNAKLAKSSGKITSIDTNGSGDIVAAEYNQNVVSVLRNNGDGTFSTGPGFAVGANPSAVASEDLDEDGVADLAVSNFTSDNVSVLWGTGGNSFQAAQNFPAGDGPAFVIGSNLNADTFPDLAVANQNSNNVSVLLSAAGDATAPTVSGISPADSATSVVLTTSVEATFSEAMNEASVEAQGTFTLKEQGSSTPVAATVAYDPATNKATLDPGSDLTPNTIYTATIRGGSTGAKDMAGNALAQGYSWSFTTASPSDPIAPTVLSTKPYNRKTDVARGTGVKTTFSERMNPATVDESTFKLFKIIADGATKRVANAPVALGEDGLTATLDPFGSSDTRLKPDTRYKAVVTTGATDLAGNALDQDTTREGDQPMKWIFTTR